jgi:lipopolysaccharide/colanic/teichoic acid biosynthesis glycosyltransferase
MTAGKRALDILLALMLGIVLGPVIAGLALWLRCTQGAPVFYASERMTTPERGFTLWKFRTMTLAATDSGVSGGDKAARITPAGRWLRRTRLDELPQLWNILRGDLSFVGPRPPLREYVERFPETYGRVLRSRPGVTGLATLVYHAHEEHLLARCHDAAETDAVYGRACVPRKARLDLIYAAHRSVCFDLVLIARTAAKVLGR